MRREEINEVAAARDPMRATRLISAPSYIIALFFEAFILRRRDSCFLHERKESRIYKIGVSRIIYE